MARRVRLTRRIQRDVEDLERLGDARAVAELDRVFSVLGRARRGAELLRLGLSFRSTSATEPGIVAYWAPALGRYVFVAWDDGDAVTVLRLL